MQNLMKIYTLRDSKSEIWYTPQYFNTDAEAVRFVQDMVQFNPQSPVSKFPEDFDLYYLGTYNANTGQINAETPEHITKAVSYKKPSQMQQLMTAIQPQ